MAGARFLPLILSAWLAAAAARAGEAACWVDAGVVVVPAEVAGIAGDYILDTGTAQTTLDETRALAAGFEGKAVTGDVRLAGQAVTAAPVAIAALDARTWNLPTPAAGVIGADVLRGYVLDLNFAPCRLRLSAAGAAPRERGGRALPIAWDAGRPVVRGEAADGAHGLAGPFVVATGSDVPVRLADDAAAAPGAGKPDELYPGGAWLARLPQLGFAGRRLDDLAAGLVKPEGEAAGVIGGAVLARFRLRFDFPAGILTVAPLTHR